MWFILLILIFNVPQQKERLTPCPDSPNCVNSLYPDDENHFIPPHPLKGNSEKVWSNLKKLLAEDSDVTIQEESSNFIHAVFTIPLFGYKDDVLFYLDEDSEKLHYRSASRVGYYDFGVNRSRIRKIRKKLSRLNDS